MIRLLARGLGLVAVLVACSDVSGPNAAAAPAGTPSLALGLATGATADTLTVGQTRQLTAALPQKRGKRAASPTVWTSSNPAVATVTQTGLVTAVGAGRTVVTARNSFGADSATILVVAPPPPAPPPAPAPAPGGVAAPELPRAAVDVTMPVPTGRTIAVAAGDDLQGALDAAQPGDVITLAAGATFTGNYVLPAKVGDAWITIRAGAGAALPAEGQRVTPAHAATMPKVLTPNSTPALSTAPGAHHYRVVGVEFGLAPGSGMTYSIVALGGVGAEQSTLAQVPHHVVLDRVYAHGTATSTVRRCVLLNAAHAAVVDSWLAKCHEGGADSQAIVGWNGPGPFKIVNNHLEGAGENVMFGGADPSIPNLVPSDIEIRRNHFIKPLAWQSAPWTIKNLFELKNARRVLVEGNVFENCWAGEQSGFALVWMSANQEGTAPWSTTSDVTFQYNVVRRVGGGLNLAAAPGANPVVPATRFRVAHNVFEGVGDPSLPSEWRSGRLWQIIEATHVELAHNTGASIAEGLNWGTVPRAQGVYLAGGVATGGFVVRDNVVSAGPGIGSAEAGRGYGTTALDYHFPGWTARGNVLVGAPVGSYAYPAGNLYPATAAAGGLSSDLRVVAAPALGSATTDGLTPGADRAAVEQKTAGVVLP